MSEQPVMGFRAVRGHERVAEFLRAALAHDRLAHALMFAGPDGIGKRAMALALAAQLLCELHGDDACGNCAACHLVAAGTHPDLHVVTLPSGKKEIGVERARELKRFTQMRAMRGDAKIGIVDDAHLLTVAAQNALLKTLEEPPPRSILILVANNPDALLPTVRSRCQRVQLFPLPSETVAEILTTLHGVEPAAAVELAALAEGSPGRALSLRSSVLGGRRAQLRQQLAQLESARYFRVMQLADQLGHPEAEVAATLELLLSQYRDEAVQLVGAPSAVLPDSAPTPRVRSLVRRADAVHAAWQAVRWNNPNRQLLLESLLLRLAAL